MAAPKFIEIDGKRFVWRDILQRRREQRMAAARIDQPALFELKEDCRSVSEPTAAGRYREPSLSRLSSRTGRAAWRSLTFPARSLMAPKSRVPAPAHRICHKVQIQPPI
jgi:hypothetical protein